MDARARGILFALLLVAVVVGADVLFFRHNTGQRLIANVAIVVVFVVVYLRFIR